MARFISVVGLSLAFGRAASVGQCNAQAGYNNAGTHLAIQFMAFGNADKCCNACSQTEGCVGYTWWKTKRECWLKDSLGDLTADADMISGSYFPPAKCMADTAYDPKYDDMTEIEWADIDLDLPAEDRWTSLTTAYKVQIKDLVDTVKNTAGKLSQELFSLLEDLGKQEAGTLLDAMSEPYSDEIRGMAVATGLSELDLLICNLIYEISGACTAIIAQDADGHIVHGHNLDTAANWNFTSGQWDLAEKLRAITTKVRFHKGGEVLFYATTYAGYAGVFEGMKPGAFSVSANTRFDSTLYASLRKWISGEDRSGQFGTFNIRDALEQDDTFQAAVERLNTKKLMGPGYFTIAGVQPGEGAIMSRSATTSYGFWSLSDELAEGRPYMVQTNYDHWRADPFFDRRRDPANDCMQHTMAGGSFAFKELFQVLAAKPTRNKMTCHSVLFSAREGKMESYQMYCPTEEPGCRPVLTNAVV